MLSWLQGVGVLSFRFTPYTDLFNGYGGYEMNTDLEMIRALVKQNREIMDEIAYVYEKLEKMDNNLIVNFFDRENDYVDA